MASLSMYPMIWTSLDRFRNFGLLLLRIGIGGMYIVIHGGRKLAGGPELWENVGGAMSNFGIDFLPMMWGFAAGAIELIGGILIVLGLLFRPAVLMILSVMIVAAQAELLNPAGTPFWPIEMGIVMIGLFFIGPGSFAVDERFKARSRLRY